MNRFPKLGPLLVGAFAVACDQPTQPTQPTVNQPQVETAKVGRWGAVPSGPTVNARLEPRSNAVAPGVRAVGVTALVVTAGEFANGSFETGDYTGWTLFEGNPPFPTFGTWGIATNGQTINPGQLVFDFFDGIDVLQTSVGLPHTYTATDGEYTALQLQNGSQTHRMYQDIALPAGATTISWDMEYNNHSGAFFPENQELAINVRDATTDVILATLFRTTEGVDPQSIPVTHFSRDVSAFRGQTVRISVDMIVNFFYFDAAFDKFTVDFRVAVAKDECKQGGWQSVFRADGSAFKNQGDCIQYVNTGK